RRKLSIGHSLHNRAIRTLLQREEAKRFSLGTRLPNIYLGIPLPHTVEKRRLRAWFANLGWNTALSRTIYSMALRNLSTWTVPDGMAKSMQNAGGAAEFDLVYGWDYAGPILDHVKTSNRLGLVEVYKLALADPSACSIIRAKRPDDKAIVGTVVLYTQQSRLAEFVPAMRSLAGEMACGISSPVISPSVADYATLLQGLILLGVKQMKRQGNNTSVLDYVSSITYTHPRDNPLTKCLQMDGDGNVDGLKAMGFEVLHDFEEVSVDSTSFSMVQPSAYGEGASYLGRGAAVEKDFLAQPPTT
ncbi:MAG: hypothetical protein INR71_15665, partial [Terriglobus roseus]|nr:hypothetical protein [Terriglobus roseus]